MMAVEDHAYSATMAWIEDIVELHPELWAAKFEFATDKGMLWVLVEGNEHEVLAWRAAVGGRIMRSQVRLGVWSKEILGVRVHVRVVDDPKRAPGGAS
jgi:hypothetical protein